MGGQILKKRNMSVRPQPGEQVKQTITTEVIPPSQVPVGLGGNKFPKAEEFWDFVEGFTLDDWKKFEAELNLYRGTSNRREQMCDQIYPEDIAARGIKFGRRWIKENYGGGFYNVMMKLDKQLRYNINLEIAGEPKQPAEITAAAAPTPTTEVGMLLASFRDMQRELIAELRTSRGGDVANEAVKQAVALNGQVFTQAAQTLGSVLHPPQSSNPIMDRFMEAMISKMMNPTDPIETFAKMAQAVQALGVGGNSGSGNLVSDAIRALPAVMTGLSNITANMSRAKQIEIEGFREMQRNGIPMRPPVNLVPEGAAAPQPRPAQPPAAAAPANGNGAGGLLEPRDGIELIEAGIVNVLIDPSRPVDECADQVLKTLDSMVPGWVDQMIAEGEDNLLKLFRERRILAQIPQNPRLAEFVKKFLQYARESRAPESPGVTSAAPPASNVAEVLEPQPTG